MSPSDRYDFEVSEEGYEAMVRFSKAALEYSRGHSRSEREQGREQLRRIIVLAQDILEHKAVAESTVEGFYIEPRRYA